MREVQIELHGENPATWLTAVDGTAELSCLETGRQLEVIIQSVALGSLPVSILPLADEEVRELGDFRLGQGVTQSKTVTREGNGLLLYLLIAGFVAAGLIGLIALVRRK